MGHRIRCPSITNAHDCNARPGILIQMFDEERRTNHNTSHLNESFRRSLGTWHTRGDLDVATHL